MLITSWDIAEMSIDAMRENNPDAVLKAGVLANIQSDCAILDSIFEKNDGARVAAEVDQETGDFRISLYCDLVEFCDGRSDPFFKVIQHVKSFSFRSEEDCVVIDFIYGGLFELE